MDKTDYPRTIDQPPGHTPAKYLNAALLGLACYLIATLALAAQAAQSTIPAAALQAQGRDVHLERIREPLGFPTKPDLRSHARKNGINCTSYV